MKDEHCSYMLIVTNTANTAQIINGQIHCPLKTFKPKLIFRKNINLSFYFSEKYWNFLITSRKILDLIKKHF